MNQPKKELGQHWLHDKSILESIVDTADLKTGDTILEIGPGLGTLTDVILEKDTSVMALEFDSELANHLQKKYKNRDNVSIITGDIRRFDFTTLPDNYKIIANIPYYLTSNLIRLLTETTHRPEAAALLMQKEVAQRICAQPGDMSLLSVIAQYYFECSLGPLVDASYFTPPPKVDSQVLVLHKRATLPFSIEEKTFLLLIKAGFSEKRKTLRNSLSGGLRLTATEAEAMLLSAGLDSHLRAQALSLDDWHKLYLAYGSHASSNDKQ